MADFSSRLAYRYRSEDEKLPFDFTAAEHQRDRERERERKFALSHRTHSPSITAAAIISAKDVAAIHSKMRGRGHVENLTSKTPVKLAANNL